MSAYLANKATLDSSYPDGFWILDDSDTGNGWCYWSKLLPKDEATNLLLDNVTLNSDMTPDDNWAYNIDVRLQAANKTEAYKLGSVGGISSEGKALINSLLGLNTIANPQDKFDSGSDQLLNLKPVPGYPGLYEVLDDNGKSARPKEYLVDPDGSVKDDSTLSGDEISVDSSFVSRLTKTYPSGLPSGDAAGFGESNGTPVVVDSNGNVLIDGVNFPDPYLRALIGQAGGWDSGYQINGLFGSNLGHIDAIDSNQDGALSQSELDAVTKIYLAATPTGGSFDQKIPLVASLQGLQLFTNLADLEVSTNQISDMTIINQLANLTTIVVGNQKALTSLDVANEPQLQTLIVSGIPQLTTLDLSKNTNLELLRVTSNDNLSSVDVTNLTNLTYLDVTASNTAVVGLSHCAALQTLFLQRNPTLIAFDVSGLTNLQDVWIYNCANLTSVNVSGCTSLSSLYAYGNMATPMQASAFDITNTPALVGTGFRFQYNGAVTITGAAGRTFTNQDYHLNGNTITYAP